MFFINDFYINLFRHNSTDIEKEKIGEIVYAIRGKLNITQTELGEAVHWSGGTIKNIESGRASSINSNIDVLNFFGLSLATITNYKIATYARTTVKNNGRQ